MSFLVRPSMNQPSGEPELTDHLLAQFFQEELPAAWPDCPHPAGKVRLAPAEADLSWLALSQLFASRLALALSVAILLLGSWTLSGSFTVTPGAPVAPEVTRHHLDIGPGVAGTGNFKITEHLVQPKDGPTKMSIEIIEIVPTTPR